MPSALMKTIRPRPAALFAAVVALWAVVGCTNPREGYEPQQPIKFNHLMMAGKQDWTKNEKGEDVNRGGYDIPCRYCHTMVDRGRHAGIPSMDQCMGCHDFVGGNREWVLRLREYWADGRNIEWVKVYDLPDFVYFNHSSHLTAADDKGKKKLDCKDCHGEVEKMQVVKVVNAFNMCWCLECHWKKDMAGPDNCTTCHR